MNLKKIKFFITVPALLMLFGNLSFSQNNANDITGTWYNEEKDGKIEIFIENGKYHGKIVWVDLEPGENGLDENNPDPELRDRSLIGLKILEGFEYDDGEYEDGDIYDPKSGNTYSCTMRLEEDDRLYVRGYVGISLIGRTTYWTRAE